MRFFSLGVWFALAAAAQILPDWHIVELAEPSRVKTREAQASVRAVVAARFAGRAAVRESLEVVANALVVQGDVSEAELAAMPGVKKVWPVYAIRHEMDRAASIIGATRAWELIGGPETAGVGAKIGIIDSGLDVKHPGFASGGFALPEGYPKGTSQETRDLAGGKVIVYRTYDSLLGNPESGEDRSGHGTGVAMVAAGVKNKGPFGEIQGVAPGAYLGVYRVFGGANGDESNTSVLVKAIDDAAADGMDVVNMSLGSVPAIRPERDFAITALDRAASLGVTVVKSSGNSGPARLTHTSPAMGSQGLTVGANWNGRIFGSGIRVNDGEPILAVPGDGPAPAGPVRGPLKDIAGVDKTGLACDGLPGGSLAGNVALILRGTCTFETKLNNATAAGAIGAVVYTHANEPDPVRMGTGSAQLPAVSISYRNGLAVKALLVEMPDSTVELTFTAGLAFPIPHETIVSFSSRGPGGDDSIKPDLVAVGAEVYTAAQKANRNGDLYDPSGYTLIDGTSFAAPMVAGAYAVVKSNRPGLRPDQYRSLLVNSTTPFPASVQNAGSGLLDVGAAIQARLTMDPYSVSFGLGGQRANLDRLIRIQNASANVGTWRVAIDSKNAAKATVEPAEFSLGPGDRTDIRIRLTGDFAIGEYEGFLVFHRVDAPEDERPQRLAYWYGVPNGQPAAATLLPSPPSSASAGSTVDLNLLATDAIGATVASEPPKVTVLEGSGEFVSVTSQDSTFAGYWRIRLRMGPVSGQINRFRVEMGPVIREVSIRTR
ncbi:MAG: hypothetical protein FJW38_20835 [Acidobacteria bacterium]|nr:hypothetical protein [Acidobacteriota bacterium]